MVKEFGAENVRDIHILPKGDLLDFTVLDDEGKPVSAMQESDVIAKTPRATADYVFIHPTYQKKAKKVLKENWDNILGPKGDQ